MLKIADKSNLESFQRFRYQFTLIELLIVIAILGIMAAAVLVAINPAAKINAAKDTTVKSDMSQVVNALQAYYTGVGNQVYPAALTALTTSGELKSLPKQQGSNGGCVTTAGTDATDYCYTGTAGQNVAVWATLYTPASRTFYCWDSTSGVYKSTSATGVAGQTTCP